MVLSYFRMWGVRTWVNIVLHDSLWRKYRNAYIFIFNHSAVGERRVGQKDDIPILVFLPDILSPPYSITICKQSNNFCLNLYDHIQYLCLSQKAAVAQISEHEFFVCMPFSPELYCVQQGLNIRSMLCKKIHARHFNSSQ